MADTKTKFQLVFPENLKKDANLSPTRAMSFDDLGDFLEERERIRRAAENASATSLKVNYSNLGNHVFFDSALSKLTIAKDRVLNTYPYNGSAEEKDAFYVTGSGYENYIFNSWPASVGYAHLKGSSLNFISASDTDSELFIGSSSLYVSAWIQPFVTTQNIIVQYVSASVTGAKKYGYDFYLSGAAIPHLKFTLYSGSSSTSVSASYLAYTGSFNGIAAIFDKPQNLLSLYINNSRVSSASVSYGPIESGITSFVVGKDVQTFGNSYDYYSGSIDEIRVMLTASELFHKKNYNKPVDSEDYVKLYYKFNEGIVGTSSIDSVVVDYSKSGLHGLIYNYNSTVRVSGTSMSDDWGDPILYSFHSGVMAFTSSLELSASSYDKQNNNSIFNFVPEYVLREDQETENLLQPFCLALARYFDQIKLYVDQFDNTRITNYDNVDESPDIFLPMLQKYFGWKVTDHFGDSNPLSFFFGEGVSVSGTLDSSLQDIRNQFWKRILNNLPYLLKTKGKRYNLDSFFNVLGINKENINLKEYGYLPGGSIQDTRIHKEKVVSLLGIGTGSVGTLSSSFVKVPTLVNETHREYTVESLMQLPFVSASYSGSLLTGSIWQFTGLFTGSYTLVWNVPTIGSTQGKFVLTSSDGQRFSSSLVEVFDGDFVYVAAGLNGSQLPFIEVRTLDNDRIDFSGSYVGSTALSGVFTGSAMDFVMGANSGTFFANKTQGFYGEYRVWKRTLSGSEIDSHALHFENIGVADPLERPAPLRGHWPLNDDVTSTSVGVLNGINDFSRNGFYATGSQFPNSVNPFRKFLHEYNYLSPSIDLKWTENKVRVRNKSELKLADIASDTNEVSLEFNLVDSLNQDIAKIVSSFNLFNEAVGKPINKYRDEYADLESLRKVYFERLGDSLNFNNFFALFRWFDKKISDSIKQLLPTRVKFIGGEQVVESHALERPKYKYQYPIFRTPKPIRTGSLQSLHSLSGAYQLSFEASLSSSYPASKYDIPRVLTNFNFKNTPIRRGRISSVVIEGDLGTQTVSTYNYGADIVDRNTGSFGRRVVNGNTANDVGSANSGVNFRNERARYLLMKKDRDNE